jgi:hypothetical protein
MEFYQLQLRDFLQTLIEPPTTRAVDVTFISLRLSQDGGYDRILPTPTPRLLANVDYPFGGYRESGLGRELGEAALDNYCQTKTVSIRLGDALFG